MYKIYCIAILTCLGLSTQAQKNYTLEDVYRKGIFRPASVAAFESSADGKSYREVEHKGADYEIVEKSFEGKSDEITVFNSADFDLPAIDHHAFSSSEDILLLYTDPKPIYRHSATYEMHIYDRKAKAMIPFIEKQILHTQLSPDDKKISYIDSNNLYLYDIAKGSTLPITTDGRQNAIINGNCDWVYEEEFGFTQAYKWSPNSKHIAFYRFDESEVQTFTMQYYEDLYPRNYTFKYPKAGEDNSKLSLWLYDVDADTKKEIKLPIAEEYYVPRIFWSAQNELLILTLNRLQNHLQYFLYSPQTGQVRKIYDETDKAYVEVGMEPLFLQNGSIILASEKSGYNHLYLLDPRSTKTTALTQGNWEVQSIEGLDPDEKMVFFTGTKDSPHETHGYSVALSSKSIQAITPEPGNHSLSFSASMDYFLDEYSTTTQAPQYVLKNGQGTVISVLEDNADFKKTYDSYANSTPDFEPIKLSSGEITAMIYKPVDFDPKRKYPVLIYQYSGPGSQQVKNQFFMPSHFLHQVLIQQGYILVIADPRGTGAQGAAYKKQTYRQLGKYESDDLIDLAKKLQTYNYIDPDRIGIWGWSYGGYMSSICIMKGADVFSTAVAVAPVTNWRFYDNIYTERYMGLPQDNAEGYDDNSPTTMVSQLEGNLLLVHGLADDNVHFQNSAVLIDKLIAADKKFDSEIYPNQAHGMGSGRYHLYNRIIEYITTNL